MGPLDTLLHLANMASPAFAMALLSAAVTDRLVAPVAMLVPFWTRFAVYASIGTAVLMAGLWYFGRDGKMPSYAALVLAVATTQWLLARPWKR